MFDTLLELLKRKQNTFLEIYIKERETKGEGILSIIKDNNKADVRYYSHDNLPYKDIEEEYKTKREHTGTHIEVKNKWIITLPILELEIEKDVTLPIWNLILDDGKKQVFFQGFPQEVKLDDIIGVQYVLVTDPLTDILSKNNWTVEATTTGQQYLNVCHDSSTKFEYFMTFRSNSAYCRVITPGKKEDGQKIIDRIKNNKLFIKNLDKFRMNDLLGSPGVYKYGKYGYFSPSTLRHVNTLYELMEKFTLDNMSIIEFGGGYGGLCHVMSKTIKWKEYTFVEIEKPLELAKKCFLNANLNINAVLPDDIVKKDNKYDLFISEYGFCELNDEGIDKYICLLENSKNAYLVMNLWDKVKKEKLKERLSKIFNVVNEYPVYLGSEWGDYVWVCEKND